ncbi:WW domain-containing protein [Zea mays]|uniref:WW domain-containing protein n=1 Tax=Zea mays TaxID=4577 RepID=A0A1D6NZE5_MAIZE|nr:WW domain-containing protein [Zea mays]
MATPMLSGSSPYKTPLGKVFKSQVLPHLKPQTEPNQPRSSEQHKGPPDLAELSKDLPTGWQAYLDEYTKQVYYGNNLTSETSWERPTK